MIKHITQLQAIAQSGLAYCRDKFDIERYEQIITLTADLLAINSIHPYQEVLELFSADHGYCTPKVDVRGAIFIQDKILLVQEKSDGLWSLPGGWADVNLSPSENIQKEIKEETGFTCQVNKLIAIVDKRKNNNENMKWPHVYKLFFLCEINVFERGDFDKNEVRNIAFFERSKLPTLSLDRVNQEQIHLCFQYAQDKSLPTKFD